jgi:hypothetical protein
MNHHTQMDKSTKDHRKPARLAFLASCSLQLYRSHSSPWRLIRMSKCSHSLLWLH